MSQWDYKIDQPMPGPFPFPNSRKDPGIEVAPPLPTCFLSNVLICDHLGQLIDRQCEIRHFIQSENVYDRFHSYCQ